MVTLGNAGFSGIETPDEESEEGEEDEKHILEGFGVLVFPEELL